ncbi:MAG: transposase [Bdellovibrionaceae bacterium]|nr:transposase [Pseudobdellovibrionaceae bacterium]
MSKGRHYTPEFKEQSVRLAEELGSAKKAAEQLGIPEANIHNWRVKMINNTLKSTSAKVSVESKSVKISEDEEIKRLRKENEELKKVNYILKKAAAFFSQDHLK